MVLVLMAAGRGSRYGKLKQFDSLGPNAEFLMEFSIHDALANGFTQIVIITQKDKKEFTENYFKTKLPKHIILNVVAQDLNDLPQGIRNTFNREKPWGTAHAVWSARNVIKDDFAVLNADDFYGFSAFEKASNYLKINKNNPTYGIIAYPLRETLSENGPVSRGICKIENGALLAIEECTKLEMQNGEIIDLDTKISHAPETLISMNFWLLNPSIFDTIEKQFALFLNDADKVMNSELYLPELFKNEAFRKKTPIKVIDSESNWFGVTYANDREKAVAQLKYLSDIKKYPLPLWHVED